MHVYNVTVRVATLTEGRETYETRSIYFGNCPSEALSAFQESKRLDHPASPEGPSRTTEIKTTLG